MADHTSTTPHAKHLSANVRQLRAARGLTQARAASVAGIPRPTWAHLETGSANPTLAVLVRVAGALQVSIEELLAPPRATARHYPADTIPRRRRGGVEVRQILPDPIPGLMLERLSLPPGARMTGVPHTAGTREYLACEAGRLTLTASGTRYDLDAGDVLVFRGDQKHGYANHDSVPAVGWSVVVIAPSAG